MAGAKQSLNASDVCRLQRTHIPQLCDLFANTFRPGTPVRRREIEQCLEQTYLTSPLDRLQPASLVAMKPDGRVGGFMGIISLAALIGDQRLRCGVLGNFMAHRDDGAALAVKLLRTAMNLDLDFIFSDTANARSLDLSRALKFKFLALASLEWIKLLRPFGTMRFALRRSGGPFQKAAALLVPPLDPLTQGLAFVKLPDSGVLDRQIETPDFISRAPDYLRDFVLRPDWNPSELAWLLTMASQKTRNGPLLLREVVDRSEKTIGLYALYAAPGKVARVLQVLARPRCEDVVLGALMRAAYGYGAVAVRGPASPRIVEGLARHKGIIFHHTTSTVLFGRDAKLLEVLRSDRAFLGGLMGEGWTRLTTEDFR